MLMVVWFDTTSCEKPLLVWQKPCPIEAIRIPHANAVDFIVFIFPSHAAPSQN